MQTEIIISGFGGQGVLFSGMVLAYAGMDEGKNVTWMPSYGPEMRGGTAHAVVIISDEPIGSPVFRQPKVAMLFNNPSMKKYELDVLPGGLLVYNTSLITHAIQRADLRYVPVAANDIAAELGNVKMANMVMAGAMIAATGLLPLEAVLKALKNHLPASKQALVAGNVQALQRGAALAEKVPA